MRLVRLRLDEIRLPDWDVRAFRDPSHLNALLEDLKRSGQCEPVHVMKTDDGYLLLEGRTRLEAARKLGWKEINAYVVEQPPEDPYEYAFKINALKRPLGPVSVARYMEHLLVTRGWSWGDLMQYLGVSKATVARYMKLLDLPVEEQLEYELGRKPIRGLYGKNVRGLTRETGRKGGDSSGVRCPICGAYPRKGMGKWIYICGEHEDEYDAIMDYIMRRGWLMER